MSSIHGPANNTDHFSCHLNYASISGPPVPQITLSVNTETISINHLERVMFYMTKEPSRMSILDLSAEFRDTGGLKYV
jgi:hypothetical protein